MFIHNIMLFNNAFKIGVESSLNPWNFDNSFEN